MKNLITLITCLTISVAAEGRIGGVTYFDYTNSEEKSAFNFNRQYFSYTSDNAENINYKIIFDEAVSTTARMSFFMTFFMTFL